MRRFTPTQVAPSSWDHAKWFLRWRLLALLVVDLVGLPFHDHAHDLGADRSAEHWLHAETSSNAWHSTHFEHTDGHRFSHSLVALQSASRPSPQVQVGSLALPAVAPISPLLLAAQHEPSTRAVGRVSIPADRFRRPEGRAPPLLHL